jgi:hypothetical protein
MLVYNVSHPAICNDSRIGFWCFVSRRSVCVGHVFSFYLKMTRTKKFASKPKLRGNKYEYICVNKATGVSENGQPVSDQSGESSCAKHNLTS